MDPLNRISRTNASFPDYLDFQKLREKGIVYCQRLASDLWTDFNLHDPGLTILEVLCYALTDLGYRTNLPIEELVARSPEQKKQDQKLAAADGKPFDDNFFTAEQVLTCNPVTILDLRRLLIDVPGVRNAWIERAETAETVLYLDKNTAALEFDQPKYLKEADEAGLAAAKVTPDGLYLVCLELDDEPEPDPCGDSSIPLQRVLDDVWTLLHRHRNLCEDFLDVTVLNEEQITLCVDVEIKATAEPGDVLLEMYKALSEFLSPTIRFYSLQEMLARGKSIEEIYEGRPHAPLAKLIDGCRVGACSHGFIDTAELEKSERRTELYASDLYQTIMQISGVSAVRKLSMANAINGIAQTRGEKWCLRLTPWHRPVFDLANSTITFYKDPLFFRVDEKLVADVNKRFGEERAARAKAPLAKEYLDSPPPEGRFRLDLGDYHSIMHELPVAYGIGVGEVAKSAPPKRLAQVHQLRAYLLVYDQILANYMAQLANLRELFSMRPDESEGRKNRTYFTKRLGKVDDTDDGDDVADVPVHDQKIGTLLREYEQSRQQPGAAEIPKKYRRYLDYIAERPETYHERRNRFLDHLLARFAESFTDYVLLMLGVSGQGLDKKRIIRDKTRFLVDYPETSHDRGKGFDYSEPAVWDTDNVSGLNKRVSRMLGFGTAECETEAVEKLIGERRLNSRLCHVDVVKLSGTWHWSVTIEPPESEDGERLELTSPIGYGDEAEASAALERFRHSASELRNYSRLVHSSNGVDYHGFAVLSGDRTLLAKAPRPWPEAETRDRYLVRLLEVAHRGAVSCEIGEEGPEGPRGAWCIDVIGAKQEVLLSGVEVFHSRYLAEQEQQAIEDLIHRPERYRRGVNVGGVGLYGIELVDENGKILARDPRYFTTPRLRNEALLRVKKLVRDRRLNLAISGSERGHWFRLKAGTDGPALTGISPYPSKQRASAACAQLAFRLQDPDAYKPDDSEHRLLLTDPDGTLQAASETGSPQELEAVRDAFIEAAESDPEWSSKLQQASNYRCRLTGRAERVLLETVRDIDSEGESWRLCDQIVEKAQQDSRLRRISASDGALYGFEVMGEGDEILATHPAFYSTAEERDERILAVKCLAGAEGFHLVEHLLLRPRGLGDGDEQESEKLLPIAREQGVPSTTLTSFDADPYSFRATVVVPYWPRRFSEIKFRRFFERTLRKEAPAHVFLKVCWVSSRQMRAFEDAYGKWRHALAHPDCDRTAPHSALVEVLLDLRSVYPEGRLFGAGVDEENPPMILDQTKLGSAGVPS